MWGSEVEPVGDVLGVAQDLGLRRVPLGPVPFLLEVGIERVGVLQALHVAARTRVAVPVPGAADVAAGLDRPHRAARRSAGGERRTSRRIRRRRRARRGVSDPCSDRSSLAGRSRSEPATTIPTCPNRTGSSGVAGRGQNRVRWTSTCHPRITRPVNGSATGSPPTRIPTGKRPRRGRLRGAALADAVGARCRPDRPDRHRRRTRRERGSADRTTRSASAGRHRRSCSPAPPSSTSATCRRSSAARSSGVSCSPRPRPGRDLAEPRHAGRTRRRRVRHQRVEDLVERCAPFAVRHPDRPHRSRPAEAQGHLVLHLPMDTPGLSMRPIVDMTTAHSFNQVFFDDVRTPGRMRVGDEGDGWRLAKVTLSNERVSLSSAGSLWGVGPSAEQLHRPDPRRAGRHRRSGAARRGGRACTSKPSCCASTACAALERDAARARPRARGVDPEDHGRRARPARDVARQGGRRCERHARRVGAGRRDAVVDAGRADREQLRSSVNGFADVEPIWHYGYLFHPALTLGGGTFAVQRNIVAEHVLGLPRSRTSSAA